MFKTNINSDTKIYDLELNQIYIDMLTDDEKERDNLAKLLKYHNNVIETQKRNELDREKTVRIIILKILQLKNQIF